MKITGNSCCFQIISSWSAKARCFPCSWRKYSRDIHNHMTSCSLIASALQRKQSSISSGIEDLKITVERTHYILSGAAKKEPPSYKRVPFWRKELSHLRCTYPSLNLNICSWGKSENPDVLLFLERKPSKLGDRVLFPYLPWSRMEFLSFWAGGGMSWFKSHTLTVLTELLLLLLLLLFCCVLLDFNDFLKLIFLQFLWGTITSYSSCHYAKNKSSPL